MSTDLEEKIDVLREYKYSIKIESYFNTENKSIITSQFIDNCSASHLRYAVNERNRWKSTEFYFLSNGPLSETQRTQMLKTIGVSNI